MTNAVAKVGSKLHSKVWLPLLGMMAVVHANAEDIATLDGVSNITETMTSATTWLKGTVLTAIVGLLAAVIVIAVVKFGAKKAKP